MNLHEATKVVESSEDFRLLRRIPRVEEWDLPESREELRRAVVLDTETTGLDPDKDEVVELAMLPILYARESGRIVGVEFSRSLSALREPSFRIPQESTAIHGITDDQVRGHKISDEQVRAIVDSAQLIIAHNAAFDRPMAEKHWPIFEEKAWACSLRDIDWASEGIESGKLDYVLMRQGWFYESHRALTDASAAAFLLTLPLPKSGLLAMGSLLGNARRPLRAVRAEETSFEQRAAFKQRGYRWDAGNASRQKAWWILTDNADGEIEWLRREIYQNDRSIPVINVPATKRYSSRLWH